ncbi:hypothetical protein [Aliivibrio fischeri]|uniref:hypothetical protein n=1 Tax=Aliivibrio fischeri TaxID=668 RepID=UPI0002F1E10C|nr:hypothetical protein [Aliivibrio fischeri]OEE16300.1 hypothetical protein A1Q3_16920 [Aliivibrio fischeri ZF-211]
MSKSFIYKSDDYDRQAQRFVVPLYLKDELGNYQYSSTATLAMYNDHYYLIFAAHAVPKDNGINLFHILQNDGSFYKIEDISVKHKVFVTEDIVIVDCFNQRFDGKNYFNLNETHLRGFEKNLFAWIGFPSSMCKSKKIHNSRSSESLKNEYVHSDDTGLYFKSARYFSIMSKIKANNQAVISGEYERKNAYLKYKGEVSTSVHPSGMSGGAMYFFSKSQQLKDNLDDTFRFAGIGIEYKKDKTIIGVPRCKVLNLIEELSLSSLPET